jgi:hypothetical protein
MQMVAMAGSDEYYTPDPRGVMQMVARDGIEPPTPAFSGPPTDAVKSSGISGSCSQIYGYGAFDLGAFGIISADFGSSMYVVRTLS